jgi:AraC family transcriptional regulator
MNVDVKNLPGYHVAYVRVLDGYQSQKIKPAFQKVLAWAGARDLLGPQTLVLGVSLDNPEVTPADKCRYDACVTVPPATKGEGEIGVYDIAAGKYAVYRVEGDYAKIHEQLGKAWDALMGDWFPDSGYQPDDRPCFEIYHETEAQMKAGQYIVDICEPVKPL